MEIGIVGLGKMGGNMARRLRDAGHSVVGYDVSPDKVKELSGVLSSGASSLEDLASKLHSPRTIWFMVPAGAPTDEAIDTLIPHLSTGDVLIDGGNSYYKDSIRHGEESMSRGIHFLDIGVSGGIWGLQEGYCLMAGGEKQAFQSIEPILAALAPAGGYAYVGPSGAGHFAKMVHNGVEYGMLEAYGEGFELLKASSYGFDLHQLSALWLHGSVVRSWLLELAERAFSEDPDLSSIEGYVEDSGEGRWTVHEAVHMAVPVPVIADALFERYRSRQKESFSAKVIAALRHEFGGHKVIPEPGEESEQKPRAA